MPTYDYQCRACGAVTEVIHSMLDDGPSVCESCGGELRRVLYPAGIIFKGSGFYTTDSRSSNGGAGGAAGPGASSPAASSTTDAGGSAGTASAPTAPSSSSSSEPASGTGRSTAKDATPG